MKEKIETTTQFLKEKGVQNVELGILLGTGLERLSNDTKIAKEIPYSEIPHFPISTQAYHIKKDL